MKRLLSAAVIILFAVSLSWAHEIDNKHCPKDPDCPDCIVCPGIPDCICQKCPDVTCNDIPCVYECPDCICGDNECPEPGVDHMKIGGLWFAKGALGVNFGFMNIKWYDNHGVALQCLWYAGVGKVCNTFYLTK